MARLTNLPNINISLKVCRMEDEKLKSRIIMGNRQRVIHSHRLLKNLLKRETESNAVV